MAADPANPAPGAPRYDDFALPHALTYASVITGGLRNYLAERWDEALRDNRDNALAMFRDGWLQALLNERIRGTSGLNWHLEPDDAKDPRQQEAAALVTAAVKRTPRLRRFLRQLLLAVWYGRVANQVVWDYVPVNGKRALVVKQWFPLDGDKIVYTHAHEPCILVHASEASRLPKSETITTDRGLALLLKGSWRQRFLLHSSDPADADFFAGEQASAVHGVGLRSRCYWLWFLRDELNSWQVDALERTGLGLVVMLYEQGNAEAKTAMEQVAKDYSRRSIVQIPVPPGTMNVRGGGRANGIEIVETPTAGIEILEKMKERLEDQIERLFVGQSMSDGSDNESGLGGTGRAKFAEGTQRQIFADDADDLAESMTGSDSEPGLVSMIFRWTLPQLYGKFGLRWCFDLEEVDTKERLDAVSTFIQLGGSVKEDEARELTGMSKPEEHDKILSQQRMQEQQAQLQQQGQMQQMQAQQSHEAAQGQQSHRQQLEQGEQAHRQGLEKLTAEQQAQAAQQQAQQQHETRQAAGQQQHEQAMQPAPDDGEQPDAGDPTAGPPVRVQGEGPERGALPPPGSSPDSRRFLRYLRGLAQGGNGPVAYAFDPDEPRDEGGRWTADGAASRRDAWESRDSARQDARAEAEAAADMTTDPALQEAQDRFEVAHAAAIGAERDAGKAAALAAQDFLSAWAAHWDAFESQLALAGETPELAAFRESRARADAAVKRKIDAHRGQAEKADLLAEQLAAHQAQEPQEPAEPEEPDYPDEPDPESYGEDVDAYEQAVEAHGAEVERLEEAHERATEQWQEEHDRWQKQAERWDAQGERLGEKLDAAKEKLSGRQEALLEAVDGQYSERLYEAAYEATEALIGRLDDEDEADAEPEEDEDAE